MSHKTLRKIGFFSALTMLVGSVVGIGIFFKNASVLGAAGGNGATALTGWIIGGVLSLFAAISFSEIGSQSIKKISGLPAWSKTAGGDKYGYFVKISFSLFYYGILTLIVGYFVSELFFQFLSIASKGNIKVPQVWVHAIVAFVITAISLTVSMLSIKTSGVIQNITTIVKFIPILIAIIVGIVLPSTHNAGGSNYFDNGTSFTFTGLLAGLPSVLFAYDSFLGVGQMTHKIKGGVKTTSKVVLFGLISITILYSLLAVSAMLHGGLIGTIIQDALPVSSGFGIDVFVHLALFISGWGVLNGIGAANASTFQQLTETESIFGMRKMTAKFGKFKTTFIYLFITNIFWFAVGIVPAIALNTDQYVDAVSNFPTLFFFAVYAITALMYLRKRDKIDSQKMNSNLLKFSVIAFFIGTMLVIIYQLTYGFTIKLFLDPNIAYSGLGLFAPSTHDISNIEFFGIFVGFLILFGTIPYINKFLMEKFEKKSVYATE